MDMLLVNSMSDLAMRDEPHDPRVSLTLEELTRLATTGRGPAIVAGAMVLACAGGFIAWMTLRSSFTAWLRAGGFRVPPELEQDWAEFVFLMDEKGRDWSRSS